ncbi:MAG: phospholipase D family protein [Chloroflexota bacterium]|nr:phospholipase D family protein [Chloroflexota bacterium]MDE2684407.1 phospholipase D family protein [Chloroflexota bacterium]
MAEFLTTADISARLQKMIRESSEYIVLISPYLQLNPRIRELLEQKARTETHIRIIYGKRELQPEEREWIDSVPAIDLCFRQSLHAKCYLNEKEAILTSMNLYEFSEQHNDEMGIVVSSTSRDFERDRDLYRKIYQEAEQIAELSEKIREVPRPERTKGLGGLIRRVAKDALSITDRNAAASGRTYTVEAAARSMRESDDAPEYGASALSVGNQSVSPMQADVQIPTPGVCIRCKEAISADPLLPYCDYHWQIWKRFENDDYPENYCHICGCEWQTSRRKPLCWDCFQNYKDVFNFATRTD